MEKYPLGQLAGGLLYFMRRFGFAVAPVAIGLILGEMVETNLQNSLKMFDGQWWLILTQPLAAFFLILSVLGLFGPMLFSVLMRRPKDAAQQKA